MSQRFDGKTAIVTGASQGIGLAIARRLTADGASLVLVAAPSDEHELAMHARELGAHFVAGDVGDPGTADRAVALVNETWHCPPDLLASNAGIAHVGHVLEAPLAHLDDTLRVNVRGMYLFAVATARAMATGVGGAIVCTGSTSGDMGEEFEVTYNVSKSAVGALARSLAVDLAPNGIRVNAVAPGWVQTPATATLLSDQATWGKHRTHVPLDRPANSDEIANVVSFLLSDEASYMTGAVVPCDGGMTAGFRVSGWAAAPTSHSDCPKH